MNVKTQLRMTASERALGRFMRAPDHPNAEGEGAETPSDADQPSDETKEEELTTEEQLEREFGDDSGEYDANVDDEDDPEEEDDEEDLEEDDDESEDESGDTDESDDEGGDSDEPEDQKPEPDPELVQRLEAAEAEAARLRKAAEDKGIDLDATEGPEIPDEPNPEDYKYGEHDQEYIKDHAKYEAKMEVLQEQAETRFKAEAASLDARWAKNLTENKARFPDYDEVVVKGAKEGKWNASPVVAVAIKDSDVGTDLSYHLASHPEEAERISKLSPLEQAREVGRLEVTLKNALEADAAKEKRAAERTAKRRVTNAPPPPKRRTSGRGGRTSTNADTDDFEAFEKMADEKLQKAGNRMGL